MSQLKSGSSLQGGKYRIEKVLGQGGFGITYLATQELLDRKVCIKEFFFKEYCERDEATSNVSLGTQSSHEMVERFMTKFLKEARTISQLDHPNIIRIHDIFKENNTAYYVMEYIEGESLSDKVNNHGALHEADAMDYIRQTASALDFIHQRSINHLDIKPANIMVRSSDNKAILIDFGLSKQYDEQGGQTSTTPVGISHGYAPMEQYKQGGVSTFSPQTDIYALGATLYKLVTGNTPPQAMDILDEGLPSLPASVSTSIADTIKKAMQPRKVDRPDKIEDFVNGLTVSSERVSYTSDATEPLQKKESDEETRFIEEINTKPEGNQTEDMNRPQREPVMTPEKKKNGRKNNWLAWLIVIAILGGGAYFIYDRIEFAKENARIEEAHQARQRIRQQYISFIKDGDDFFARGDYLSAANCYGHAYKIEQEYQNTPYAKEFNEGAYNKQARALQTEQDSKREQARLYQEQQKRAAEIAEQRRKAEAKAEEERRLADYSRTHGSINGHDYVDLGLSVKWATKNVGADNPSDYGDYFAWGNTSYYSDNNKPVDKSIGDISGNSLHDAARVKWGGSWRMPTQEEFKELLIKCIWTWEVYGGKNGYKVTRNGSSIFLPAAGWCGIIGLRLAGEGGYYWSSTPTNDSEAYSLYFYSGHYLYHSYPRTYGLIIRPVSE